MVTNSGKKGYKSKEGNQEGQRKNLEGGNKTRGKNTKEYRGGTQRRSLEGNKNTKWDVLEGNEEEREERDKSERGNDNLSARKRVDIKNGKKATVGVGECEKTALVIGQKESEFSSYEERHLHGNLVSLHIPSTINTPISQENDQTPSTENIQQEAPQNGKTSNPISNISAYNSIPEKVSHEPFPPSSSSSQPK